ncbi:MAG: hypothetical protein MMC33_001882, partial [Icmadophila ericetorum]|nr:hypothetical protein [Icmadophila ericetorum]
KALHMGNAFRFFKKMELRGEKLPTAATKAGKAKMEAEAKDRKNKVSSTKANKDAERASGV